MMHRHLAVGTFSAPQGVSLHFNTCVATTRSDLPRVLPRRRPHVFEGSQSSVRSVRQRSSSSSEQMPGRPAISDEDLASKGSTARSAKTTSFTSHARSVKLPDAATKVRLPRGSFLPLFARAEPELHRLNNGGREALRSEERSRRYAQDRKRFAFIDVAIEVFAPVFNRSRMASRPEEDEAVEIFDEARKIPAHLEDRSHQG